MTETKEDLMIGYIESKTADTTQHLLELSNIPDARIAIMPIPDRYREDSVPAWAAEDDLKAFCLNMNGVRDQ